MVDGLFFCATVTGRRGGHAPFVQAGPALASARPVGSIFSGPTQWLVQKLFKRASSHNNINHELW